MLCTLSRYRVSAESHADRKSFPAYYEHMPLSTLRDWRGAASVRYRAFSHDVTAAILVFQNNEKAAMLVYLENPLGFELFSHVNAFFCSNEYVKRCWPRE